MLTWELQAVKRWFDDTYTEATRGDVKQQALLGQMYAEGYGCEKDPKAAAEWSQRAANRGYKMQGVYCEL
jgi:TPR repeat protein